jgi:group II intron reverse transcriptase/maturase
MHGNSSHGTWEIPSLFIIVGEMDRLEKAMCPTSNMNGDGKSDDRIVPKNPPNNGDSELPAEKEEGSRSTKGNTLADAAFRTQSRGDAYVARLRVREVARRDRRARFTSLMHHVTVDLLRESFFRLKRNAVPGVDGVTWREYEEHLEDRLLDLHARVHRGSYRAQPSKRTYIPKPDGRMRPLGIAALEDKIVQQAIVSVLSIIYETDFLGFSYGFRTGRSQHDALDALWVGLAQKHVNWVLDADIQGFFDTIDHGWLLKFLEHRIGDPRILRLIQKWLRAGVSEEDQWSRTTVGTPQGAVISPLLSNVFLHYVLDLWVEWWRKQHAIGNVIVVRYADDFVMGFQHRPDASRFLRALKERLAKFKLSLHPEKTRLIAFGRFADRDRRARGKTKCDSFDFLGFTHLVGKNSKSGRFLVRRQTSSKRLRAKLQQIKQVLMAHRHERPAVVGAWIRRVVQGYFNYHVIPGNLLRLGAFRTQVIRYWLRALKRRSEKHRMTWARFGPLVDRWIPRPQILHPFPNVRFFANHPR